MFIQERKLSRAFLGQNNEILVSDFLLRHAFVRSAPNLGGTILCGDDPANAGTGAITSAKGLAHLLGA